MHDQYDSISISDDKLVRQSQKGDAEAMERLIVRYQDRIYNTILKICGNSDDAAELTQETFVKFIEKLNTFRGESSFYTWLFRIAVNLTLNFCSRRAKLPVFSLDASQRTDLDGAATQLTAYMSDKNAPDPAVLAQNREINQIILESIAKLDQDHRAVVVLRDIEQMSYSQIAEILEIEMGTVKSRISRARQNLREMLGALVK